ncbi:hypothetical protein OEZ49_08350 [Ruegeria sp. WL0004]|uniref:Transposase n=1 Tax=Ruegeria marisflavi TaxID=2984152 RepID=A0ABT2WPE5_9RHOB|nr:hypothetical protein [Ruegeria sp. WL0004]MCU9837774.1 hypothetical protein [Ruegeria sp. WL0004]
MNAALADAALRRESFFDRLGNLDERQPVNPRPDECLQLRVAVNAGRRSWAMVSAVIRDWDRLRLNRVQTGFDGLLKTVRKQFQTLPLNRSRGAEQFVRFPELAQCGVQIAPEAHGVLLRAL